MTLQVGGRAGTVGVAILAFALNRFLSSVQHRLDFAVSELDALRAGDYSSTVEPAGNENDEAGSIPCWDFQSAS